jgi:hypothetical protein
MFRFCQSIELMHNEIDQVVSGGDPGFEWREFRDAGGEFPLNCFLHNAGCRIDAQFTAVLAKNLKQRVKIRIVIGLNGRFIAQLIHSCADLPLQPFEKAGDFRMFLLIHGNHLLGQEGEPIVE